MKQLKRNVGGNSRDFFFNVSTFLKLKNDVEWHIACRKRMSEACETTDTKMKGELSQFFFNISSFLKKRRVLRTPSWPAWTLYVRPGAASAIRFMEI